MTMTETEVVLTRMAREVLKTLDAIDLSPLRNRAVMSEQERNTLQVIANAKFQILSGMSEVFTLMADTDITQQEHGTIHVAR
jgi:hypothetical protein